VVLTSDLGLHKVKAFAVDIDGTLTENGEGMIHLPSVSKLRFLERSGYKVFFATGRSAAEAYFLSVFCGTTKVSIGENGGVVATGPDEFTILGDKGPCMKGYDLLKQQISGVQIKPVFPRLSEIVLARTFDFQLGKSLLAKSGLDLYLSDSNYAYHINQLGIDKAKGLEVVLELMNIRPKEVVAIGDSQTDIPLFHMCGLSIALGHSEHSVKTNATYVVQGNSGIGLSNAIEYVSLHYLREQV
jgi:phosphoglycolate phosphatase (TIGR01487 family)